jgi:hypothetical protein
MLNDISLPAIAAVHADSVPAAGQKLSAMDPTLAAPGAPPITNPTLRLDAALGLVVIEFRNQSGAVTTSIPSERQLRAYERWAATRLGPMPAGKPPPLPQPSAAPFATGSVTDIQSDERQKPEPSQENS